MAQSHTLPTLHSLFRDNALMANILLFAEVLTKVII